MCCRVFHCCCCFDLRRGVQVLGLLFLIGNIIGMISNIVTMSNTNKYYSNCLTANSAIVSFIETSTVEPFYVSCEEGMSVDLNTVKYWNKNFGAILGTIIAFEILGIIVHVLLIWGATVGNRCMLLPWMILCMMAIVLGIIALIFVIIGCAMFGLFAMAGGQIAIALIFPTLGLALLLYFWIVVQGLYKQIGEEQVEANAVSPMYGNGRVSNHNNWSRDEEVAYDKHHNDA